ncbi:hypothetical protein OA77_21435, partial [Pseudomonas coronafaciens]
NVIDLHVEPPHEVIRGNPIKCTQRLSMSNTIPMSLPMIDIKRTPPAHLANGQIHDASVKKAELLLTKYPTTRTHASF